MSRVQYTALDVFWVILQIVILLDILSGFGADCSYLETVSRNAISDLLDYISTSNVLPKLYCICSGSWTYIYSVAESLLARIINRYHLSYLCSWFHAFRDNATLADFLIVSVVVEAAAIIKAVCRQFYDHKIRSPSPSVNFNHGEGIEEAASNQNSLSNVHHNVRESVVEHLSSSSDIQSSLEESSTEQVLIGASAINEVTMEIQAA